jgi:hypothetical protein
MIKSLLLDDNETGSLKLPLRPEGLTKIRNKDDNVNNKPLTPSEVNNKVIFTEHNDKDNAENAGICNSHTSRNTLSEPIVNDSTTQQHPDYFRLMEEKGYSNSTSDIFNIHNKAQYDGKIRCKISNNDESPSSSQGTSDDGSISSSSNASSSSSGSTSSSSSSDSSTSSFGEKE